MELKHLRYVEWQTFGIIIIPLYKENDQLLGSYKRLVKKTKDSLIVAHTCSYTRRKKGCQKGSFFVL